jgi:hypothetical protein
MYPPRSHSPFRKIISPIYQLSFVTTTYQRHSPSRKPNPDSRNHVSDQNPLEGLPEMRQALFPRSLGESLPKSRR